jgi:DNA (cytosine-5)-methyltransferase 1
VESDKTIWNVYSNNFRQLEGQRPSAINEWFDSPVGAALSLAERRALRQCGAVDFLLGGPPCQGHSNLNNHTRGDDPKNELYLRVIRAAEVLEPKFVLIENVPAVLNDAKKVVQRSSELLTRLGYSVWAEVVATRDIGVPQLRRRHVLMASKESDTTTLLVPPRFLNPRTVRWAIGDLVGTPAEGLMNASTALSTANARRARWLITNRKFDLPNRMRPECHRDKPDHRYKSMYGRLRWTAPAQTITTGFRSPGQGRFLHPSEPRVLTCREAARLQFFPDWFDFTAAGSASAVARAIGNAVPPQLGRWAAKELLLADAARKSESNLAVAAGASLERGA